MNLKKLSLTNFRNYTKKTFTFKNAPVIISGPNGAGKTNILEAILLLCIGKSFRSSFESDMVKIGNNFARIEAIFSDNTKFEIILERSKTNRIKKTFKINNSIKPLSAFTGNAQSILFAPEDIRLVAGSPSRRREHLDRILIQVYPDYQRNLSKYNRVLRHRNKILEKAKGQDFLPVYKTQINIWNDQLVETGVQIQHLRQTFFDYAAEYFEKLCEKVFGDEIRVSLKYKKSPISQTILNLNLSKDLLYGNTQLGPHRDDYVFVLLNEEELNLKSFGSRGQQRTAVLAVKLLELQFLKEKTDTKPLLLLDDIFSELDPNYRKSILNIIDDQQTVITTADIEMVPKKILGKAEIIEL